MSDIETKTVHDHKLEPTEPKTSFFDLTPNQMEKLAQAAAKKAIAETWAMGLPITTEVEGKMCQKKVTALLNGCEQATNGHVCTIKEARVFINAETKAKAAVSEYSIANQY